jgi:hypothetical protein
MSLGIKPIKTLQIYLEDLDLFKFMVTAEHAIKTKNLLMNVFLENPLDADEAANK